MTKTNNNKNYSQNMLSIYLIDKHLLEKENIQRK